MEPWSELLIERSAVRRGDMVRAQRMCEREGKSVPATLRALGLVSDVELAQALADWSGLPLAARERLAGSAPDIAHLNHRFLARHAILPVALAEGRLTVAMADPDDGDALKAMLFATGAREVEQWVAGYGDIEELLALRAPASEDADENDEEGADLSAGDLTRLADENSDAPIIRLVQRLLGGAVDRRASDVHIEPMARHVRVRYRIDGRLIEADQLSDTLAAPIALRIKVMAGLDIAESRLPQDGRLRLTVRGRDVDVRVSTSPTAYGESIVLRLLGQQAVALDLDKLGLPAAALIALREALARPHGILLVTGPTGSGKTTTLYSALAELRRPDVKILTVEDPVEVLLEGVNQVQVRPDIDLTYAATLRAFLRQDPDILMIGEIRDGETAEIAMRAALTGHLVLSTLHTNSALGAFARLRDIGTEAYLVAETVVAVMAQRLVRALCSNCAQEQSATIEQRALYSSEKLSAPEVLFEPAGCPDCGGSGFAGRLPVIEIVTVDDALRSAIRSEDADALEAFSIPGDNLKHHGLALAAAGKTSLAEVLRVAGAQ